MERVASSDRAWIAFGGRMQVGKTTAADRLVAAYGFEKDALAAPIKAIAARSFGWDGRKDVAGRRLLQELGTVGRHYDPDIWLTQLGERIRARRPRRLVVDDLRLAREAETLKGLGFVCVRITRPPELLPTLQEGAPQHETETELDAVRMDFEIANDGSFEDLYARLDGLMRRWTRGSGGAPGSGGRATAGPQPKGPAGGRGLR